MAWEWAIFKKGLSPDLSKHINAGKLGKNPLRGMFGAG